MLVWLLFILLYPFLIQSARSQPGNVRAPQSRKRTYDIENGITRHGSIRVLLHFNCPTLEEMIGVFQWAVHWDSRDPDIHFIPVHRIDGFPILDKKWNTPEYNHGTFAGSWVYNDYDEHEKWGHCCRLSYKGYFEGVVEMSGIKIVFVDSDPSGDQMPFIQEYCSKASSDMYGHVCAKYMVALECKFEYADVSWPSDPTGIER